MEIYKSMEITRINDKKKEVINDLVICEYALTIFVNEIEIAVLMCSPEFLEELTVGYLLYEGIIKNRDDYREIFINEKRGISYVKLVGEFDGTNSSKIVFTGCGSGNTNSSILESLKDIKVRNDIYFDYEHLIKIARNFSDKSETFKKTGGTHSACLCDDKEILIFKEDIGRHNALDKIFGEALIRGISTDDKFIFASGRISSEMLLKSARAGVVVIISHSAPTNLAVNIATKLNLTLVGFVRGRRMNIYSGNERIKKKVVRRF